MPLRFFYHLAQSKQILISQAMGEAMVSGMQMCLEIPPTIFFLKPTIAKMLFKVNLQQNI